MKPSSIRVTVDEIRLKNYRAFENARLSLSDLTFLVGRNGAGKSSLLDAIELLRQSASEGLENALDARGGLKKVQRATAGRGRKPAMGIAIVLSMTLPGERTIRALYGFELAGNLSKGSSLRERLQSVGGASFDRKGAEFSSQVKFDASPPVGNLVLPLIARSDSMWSAVLDTVRNLRGHELSPAHMAAAPKIGESTHLARDGANAGDVLKAVERTDVHHWIVERIRLVMDGLVDVRTEAVMGRRVLQFVQQQGEKRTRFDASQVSQGTLRSLGVLLALKQVPTASVVLLDEIENSLHPGALSMILDASLASSDGTRVVLTTHSPEVLSHPTVVGKRVRIVEWRDGVSQVYRLSEETEAAANPIDTIGWMLRSNTLWPSPQPERFAGDVLELEGTAQ